MSEILIPLSTWLHALATVIFIGHFMLLAVITIPALKSQPEATAGEVLAAISKKSRFWLYASLVVFAITGFYLMLVNPTYMGIGKFANPWSWLMLVKHVIIMGMIAAGLWYQGMMRIGQTLLSKNDPAGALRRFRGYTNGMAIAGLLVLLLTAFSQIH